MSRKEIIYISIMASVISLYVLIQAFGPKQINWSESYTKDDRIPYGGYILRDQIELISNIDEVRENHSPLYQTLNSDFISTAQNFNWIFLNTEIAFDPFETGLLLKRVRSGDQLFISAANFSGAFADSLNIESDFDYSPWDSTITNFEVQSTDTLTVSFTNPKLIEKEWLYPKLTRRYFSRIDSSETIVIGKDNLNKLIFVQYTVGEGTIYLHSNPAMFTNFFLRDKNYADYAFTALSYLPPENPLIWDEYYKVGRKYESSPIKYVLADDTLSLAWYLTMFGIVTFMIFRAKRIQRIIPIINPPVNSSIEFAKTIGDLYLEKGSHKTIALKRIDFFLEYIRSNLRLETYKVDGGFIENLSQRSGIKEKEIDELFILIAEIRRSDNVSSDTLKLLTFRIDQFYNQSKR